MRAPLYSIELDGHPALILPMVLRHGQGEHPKPEERFQEAKPLFREIEKQLESGGAKGEAEMNIEEYLLDKGRREGIDLGMQKGIDVGMQKGIDVGMQKGIDVGMQKGIDVGQREASQRVLLSLLEQRFGPLAASVVERVKNSDVPSLDRWLNRILSASSLEDLLVE